MKTPIKVLPQDWGVTIVDPTIIYGLVRRWDEGAKTFDYILKARLPKNESMIEIKLDAELGRILGSYWKQNEWGTFLGRHNMDWIVAHLSRGEEI